MPVKPRKMLIGHVHKSLKDTQSPLSPVCFFCIYFFLLSLLLLWLLVVYYDLLIGLRRFALACTYNACITRQRGSATIIAPPYCYHYHGFWEKGMRRLPRMVPLTIPCWAVYTPLIPFQSNAVKNGPGRGWGRKRKCWTRTPGEWPKHLYGHIPRRVKND